ncbi:bifunctional mannitol-1-phosphate dehydrogenase/phosphatase [Acinetobacter piscicola]|uniref:bifunctional mannitol-1-phosphate dehydrogenase/phosphatase n=1 Tax=Acinetobacter piscicola TaxID=2006115 RepID=UPI000B7CC8A0|nr:HAD family hydrolase [Acinetobacter piscicola]
MLKFKNNIVHGAIFDMDGTMFDTERLRFQTLKQASKELIGVEFSDTYLMACLGLSASSALKLAQQEYTEDIPYTEIRKRADALELEAVRQFGVPIKKGLLQVLERLRKSGLRMAVATSSRRAIAEEYLINANVYKFFDVLVCGDEVEQGKPHPEIFLRAAEKINLAPQDCLMFEDSENGIRSAHDAGGICVLFKDIKAPNEAMLSHADYYYECMYDYLDVLDTYTAHLDMPKVPEAFPQTLNQLSVGIHGFGAIGGGYLAQIFSHWDGYTRPKRMYASTRNTLFRSAVNAFGSYCIRYGQLSYDERIENMNIIDAENIQHIQEMYTESVLVAICLPESAIKTEATAIAQGLYARYVAQDMQVTSPLTVLIILNKIGAKQLLLKAVREALTTITNSTVVDIILGQNYFCDTVVNRMVSKLTDQNLYRQLNIKYNIFKQYQIDDDSNQVDIEDATKLNLVQQQQANIYIEDMRQNFQSGHILQNMDLILFNAEIDMPIYVENNSPLLQKMRQMVLVDQIKDIQTIKSRLWNGIHAMMAWYASLLGHSTIGIAMGDTQVRALIEKLVAEVKIGLSEQMPTRRSELNRLAQSFLDSCQFAYKDPCERVARDPLRKLQAQERVFASLSYNIEHHLAFGALLKGAVLGYVYATQNDQSSGLDIQQHLKQQIGLLPLQDRDQKYLMDIIYESVELIDSGKISISGFMLLNDLDLN